MKAAAPGEAIAERASPAMLPFFVCCFLMDFAGGCAMVAVPLLATEWGASPALLGYIGTASALGYVAMAAVTGWLSDRVGRTAMPYIAVVAVPLLYFLYPWLPRVAWIAPVAFVGGVALGFYWPPVESWIADVFEGKNLTRAVSGFNVAWSLGGTLGALLGGYLFELKQWAPFVFMLVPPLVAGALLTRLPKPPKHAAHPAPVEAEDHPRLKADPTALWFAWTLNFTIVFALGGTRALLPKLAEQLAISSGTVGLIVFTMSLFKLLVFIIVRARGIMPRRLALFLWPNLMLIASMIGFRFSHTAGAFVVSSVAIGIASGIGFSGSILMSLLGTAGRGARSGFHEAILGLGLLAGPFVCGLVAERWDLRAPYLVCAGLAVVVLAVQTVIWRWVRR